MHTDQPAVANGETPQPQVPEVPQVVEQTGRTLTVLENFDDKTAQSREFSIYFNAKKPPRLTSMQCTYSPTACTNTLDMLTPQNRNLFIPLRYYITTLALSGSRNLSALRKLTCLQRNPTHGGTKVQLESHAGMLRWSCRSRCARSTSAVPRRS